MDIRKKRKKICHQILHIPGVSIIVPGYNEEKVILKTIESLLISDYPEYEIIVSDDGSTDGTIKLVKDKYKDNPKISIITKNNGGKSSALNHGIENAKYSHVVCIDADSQFYPSTIKKMMGEFKNPEVGAVAGTVLVGNINNFLTRNQHIEYIVSQFFFKIVQHELAAISVIPGCIGIFKKEALIKAGMYESDTLAEDTDMTIKIQRAGYKVVLQEEAISVTEAPETADQFFKQRMRWKFGTLQIIMKHKDIIFNLKYGFLGIYALFEMLLGFIFSPYLIMATFVLVITLIIGIVHLIAPGSFLTLLLDSNFIYRFAMTNIILLGLYFIIVLLSFYRYEKESNKKENTYWYVLMSYFIYQTYIWYISCLALIGAILGKKITLGYLTRNGNAKIAYNKNENINNVLMTASTNLKT
jgi:cellulose synthase/poly-beta-1,6-N-acetylglucosamine synthase-like glycosyltransferase